MAFGVGPPRITPRKTILGPGSVGSTEIADLSVAVADLATDVTARLPTTDEKAGLAGVTGTNFAVTDDDARLPTSDEKAGLAGVTGANFAVTNDDARLADTRTPAAGSVPGGAYRKVGSVSGNTTSTSYETVLTVSAAAQKQLVAVGVAISGNVPAAGGTLTVKAHYDFSDATSAEVEISLAEGATLASDRLGGATLNDGVGVSWKAADGSGTLYAAAVSTKKITAVVFSVKVSANNGNYRIGLSSYEVAQ